MTWLTGALAGCEAEVAPPQAQWLVTVSTDAVVPQFGDRVLVEILNDAGKACSSCRRLLDGSDATALPLSFGVKPTGEPLRVRVRLLRATTLTAGAEPRPGTTIDQIVHLSDEVTEVNIRLAMACYGVDADVELDLVCNPDSAELGPSDQIAIDAAPLVVGSWGPSQWVDCNPGLPPGAVCVPGGAFLLGDAAAVPYGADEEQVDIERVVRVSPFFLDAHELTVSEFLALRVAHPDLGEPSQQGAVGTVAEFCSYRGADDNSTAALPLSCVHKRLAQDICEAREGMRLPKEAEWEFAAGNGALETAYPWGDDLDICDYAVVAHGTVGLPSKCSVTDEGTLPPGPQPSDGRDATLNGIFDLAGNLEEWVADDFEPYGQACWEDLHIDNPQCASAFVSSSVRGGHWGNVPIEASVVRRTAASSNEASQWRGLRCALSAL